MCKECPAPCKDCSDLNQDNNLTTVMYVCDRCLDLLAEVRIKNLKTFTGWSDTDYI